MRTKWRSCLIKATKLTDQPKKIWVRCHLVPAERHGRTCAQGGAGPGPDRGPQNGKCRGIWKWKNGNRAFKIFAVNWRLSVRTVDPWTVHLWKWRQRLLKQLNLVFLSQKWCIWKAFGGDSSDFTTVPRAQMAFVSQRVPPSNSWHADAVQPFHYLSTTGHLSPWLPKAPQRAGVRAAAVAAQSCPCSHTDCAHGHFTERAAGASASTSGHSGAHRVISTSDRHLQRLCCFSHQCTEQ